jgi:uncharacterized membrane protein
MDDFDPRALQVRVEKLEGELRELRHKVDSLTASALSGIARVSAALPSAIPPVQEPKPAPHPPLPVSPPAREHTPAKPVVKPYRPSRTREEWETLIGGKLLNRIGALALIIGMGFFLKYAFDNNWISETVRVLIGGGIGVLLLTGARHFRRLGLQIFAQGLLGAGIAILYLSVYASFNFYHLVPQAAAFALMSAVTLIAFFHALRYDSFAVSVLGWFGGFLTPFLLSSGEANETGLFTYILLLDAGLAAMLLKKPAWAILEFLTFAGTWAVYAAWYSADYSMEKLAVTLVFMTLFWGIFHALDLARSGTPSRSQRQLHHWTYSLNAVVFFLAIVLALNEGYSDWSPRAVLALGAAYFLTLLGVKRRRAEAGDVHTRHALTVIALLVIATGMKLSGAPLVIAWALEALALVWWGFYGKMPPVWMAALGLFALAGVRLLGAPLFPGYQAFREDIFLFNSRALAFGVLAASLGAAIVPFRKYLEGESREIRTVLHSGWSLVLFVLCSVETYDYFVVSMPSRWQIMLTAGWMAYALPMVWAGVRSKTEPVLGCGLGAALLSVGIAIGTGLMEYVPITGFTVALNSRAFGMLFLMAGALALNHRLTSAGTLYSWVPTLHRLLPLGIVLLGFSLITGETRDFFQRSITLLQHVPSPGVPAEVNRLENLFQLSLSALWLAYSLLLIGLGLWRRIQPLRILAIGLFGFTILKIFIYDLSFLDTLYRIFSFIGLGIILLGVSYVYQRYKSVIFGGAAE